MNRPARRLLAPLFAVLLATPVLTGAAEAPAPLTLEECLRRALDRNFAIAIQRYAGDNAREQVVLAESSFDPTFRVTASKSFSQQDTASSQLDGAAGPQSDTEDTRVGASKRLPTGATVDLSARLNRSENNSQFSTLNPAYSSDATLSVTQPLLKGAGREATLATVRRARLGLERAGYDFQAQVMDVLRDTEIAYYRLVFAREQAQVRQLSLEAAQKLLEENKARRATGVATDLEVLTAEVGVATQRRNVLLAEQQVRDREDALRALIGQFEMDLPLGPAAFADSAVPELDTAATFARAKQAQPEYLSARAQIDQLRIDVVTTRNARLPQVDLGGAVGYSARERTAGDALGYLPQGDGYLWQVNVSVTYPWGQRADGARYRTAVNNLDRELRRLEQLEQNILVQARAAVRAVATNAEGVDVSALATRLSERQFELEKARFDAGLSTSRRVLDAQRDLDEARVAELQARVTLREALAGLYRLEGRTLEVHGITLPGG